MLFCNKGIWLRSRIKAFYGLSFPRICPSVDLKNLFLSNIKFKLNNSEFNIIVLMCQELGVNIPKQC